MKDPAQKVYEAVYTLLNGNITLPVYSVIPDSVSSGYVYLSDFEYSNDDLKDRFMHFGNLQIQIVLPKPGPKGSKTDLNTYAGEVLNAVKPTRLSRLDLAPDFSNVYLYAQNVREFTNIFDDDRTIRRVIQLIIGIEEL